MKTKNVIIKMFECEKFTKQIISRTDNFNIQEKYVLCDPKLNEKAHFG